MRWMVAHQKFYSLSIIPMTMQSFWSAFLQQTQQWVGFFKAHPELFVVLLALLLLVILYSKIRCLSQTLCITSSDAGKVYVAKSALKELIINTCKQLNGGYKITPCVQQSGRKLAIRLQLELEADQNLMETSQRLQEHLTKVLNDAVGTDYVRSIDVVVKGLKPGKHPSSPTSLLQDP